MNNRFRNHIIGKAYNIDKENVNQLIFEVEDRDKQIKELENTIQAYKGLIEDCFSLEINLNDTFYYASHDFETLDADDVDIVIEIYKKYKYDALKAYAALRRGHDPKIKECLTDNFYKAKQELLPHRNEGAIMFEEYWQNGDIQNEIKEFDSQRIMWGPVHTKFDKFLNKDSKWKTVFRYAKLADGTLAIGSSTNDIRTRLSMKYKRKKHRQ